MSDPDPWRRLRASPARASRWRGSWRPAAAPSRAAEEPTDAETTPPATPPSPGLGRDLDGDLDGDLDRPRLARPHAVVVAVLGVAALLGTGVLLWTTQPRAASFPLASSATPSAAADPTAGPSSTADPAPPPAPVAPTPQPDVVVHVAGEVQQPGVVVLPAGSRVVDAVEAAGGALPGISLESVNLARVLSDGEQVRVGLPPDPTVDGSPADPAVAGPVDLNSAGVAELDALPGIGPVLAQRIVEWRDSNGPFTSVGQLEDVDGIGPALLEDLDGRVAV